MAVSRESTAANIKPLGGAVIRRGIAGATVAAGEIVEMQSDGYWDPADASAVILNGGIAVQGAASGGTIDIVMSGPVLCLSGGTPGAAVYVTDTAGEPGDSAGTKSAVIGFAETATILYVQFQTVAFA